MLDEIKRAEQKEKIVPSVNEPKPFKSEGYSNYIKKNSLRNEQPPSDYSDFPKFDANKPISGATKVDPNQNKYNETSIAQKKIDSGYDYPKLDQNSYDFNKNKSPNINYMGNRFDNKQPMYNRNDAAPPNNYGARRPSNEIKVANNPPAISYTKNFSQNNNDPSREQFKKQNLDQPIKSNYITRDGKPKKPEDYVNREQINNYGIQNKEKPNLQQQSIKANINNWNTKTNKQEEAVNFNQFNNYGAKNRVIYKLFRL